MIMRLNVLEYLIPKIKSNYIILLFFFNFQIVNENALDNKKTNKQYILRWQN